MPDVFEGLRTRKKLRNLIEVQARLAYQGSKLKPNRAWFFVSEFIRLQHLKEIGYAADFSQIDDFTMNCFVLISETFAKCREKDREKQRAQQKAKRRK